MRRVARTSDEKPILLVCLVHKGWAAKRRAVKDDRVAVLSLTRRGNALARHIERRVRHVEATLTERKVPL